MILIYVCEEWFVGRCLRYGLLLGKTMILTGKEEHISAIAIPTNHVKNVTTTHPHIKLAGPAYRRLAPYRGVPVKTAMLENVIAIVLNRVCKKNPRSMEISIFMEFFKINGRNYGLFLKTIYS